MRFWIISLAVLLTLGALVSLAIPLARGETTERPMILPDAGSTTVQGALTTGETLYQSRCLGCHAPQARFAPRHDTPEFWAKYPTDEALVQVIRSGRYPMPGFGPGAINDVQLAQIISYMHTLAKK
jgi:mono/diheme cytochrome c family protein